MHSKSEKILMALLRIILMFAGMWRPNGSFWNYRNYYSETIGEFLRPRHEAGRTAFEAGAFTGTGIKYDWVNCRAVDCSAFIQYGKRVAAYRKLYAGYSECDFWVSWCHCRIPLA